MERTKWTVPKAAFFALVASALGYAAMANDTVALYTQSVSTPAYDNNGNLLGYGGEFTAITGNYSSSSSTSLLTGLGYVSATISSAGGEYGFDTFCLQQTVDVNAGLPANYYSLSKTGGFSPDGPVTAGVAYLYSLFATGKLTDYNYGSGRATSSDELQDAIWILQGEPVYDSHGNLLNTSSDPFLQDVITQFSSLSAAEAAATPGEFGVGVMLLTSGDSGTGTALQDQLILLPGGQGSGSVPDGGATICLLGLAFGGIFLHRRQSVA